MNTQFLNKELKLASILLTKLSERNFTIATAESCTGGLIASAITSVPGASESFHYGFVTYSDEEKEKVLKIDSSILKCGMVSAEVAEAMASGARKITGANVTIAITGYAGPGGGTKLAPVGTAFIAVSGDKVTELIRRQCKGGREEIRREFTLHALQIAIEYLDRL